MVLSCVVSFLASTADKTDSTVPADGAGLFCGVLNYLLRLRDPSTDRSWTPKVLATTHFHEVLTNSLLDSTLPINYVHLEAMLTDSSGEFMDVEDAVELGKPETNSNRVEIHYLYRYAPQYSDQIVIWPTSLCM
jgi:hypothetical protein